METVMSILHVVGAVFIVGPMAILPMSAMRAVRAGNAGQVAMLAKSTNLFSWLSLLVVVFGFGVMGMADEKYDLSITTPWVLWSIILYVVALALSVFLVVPTMRKAAEAIEATPSADSSAGRASYPAIAAGSGVAALLLVAVVVLMVWKP
ncbi:DUF2269 family protein [Leifsonia sp. YAF41]|uniref:DUF2269 family protein n=1 Tax=Leifsonia sp. YAF41 TaxID=3233086 RepID=UPI003F9DFAB1